MSTNNLLSLAGWMILPNLATGWIQSVWYGITIRAGDPKPQPGSPRFVKHHRRIRIAVIAIYLLYTIYEADWNIQVAGDYYKDFGVVPGASDREVKSRFRRLAAIHHPDKVSATNPSAEGYFLHLKTAQDVLLDPAKRFAYERFGPSITTWRNCSSIRDYLMAGLQQTAPYYLGGAIVMYVLGMFGVLQWAVYWRWLTLVSMCVFELHTVSRPHFPLVAAKVLNPILTTFTQHPPYLPFQLIEFLRKVTVTLFIAFSQVGPLLLSPEEARLRGDPFTVLNQQLERLEQVAVTTDVEMSRLISYEMAPFQGDEQVVNEVEGKVKDWLIQNTIKTDPIVRDAIGNVIRKRRTDAPAGARGNR